MLNLFTLWQNEDFEKFVIDSNKACIHNVKTREIAQVTKKIIKDIGSLMDNHHIR